MKNKFFKLNYDRSMNIKLKINCSHLPAKQLNCLFEGKLVLKINTNIYETRKPKFWVKVLQKKKKIKKKLKKKK